MKTIAARVWALAVVSYLTIATCMTAAPAHLTGFPFLANEGQTDARVAFTTDTLGGTVFITRDAEIVYALRAERRPIVLRERFVGKLPTSVEGDEATHATLRRFIGTTPNSFQRDIATYQRVAMGTAWPGIDVHLLAGSNNVEKIFDVAPGADPSKIIIEVKGADGLRVDADGTLVAHTTNGDVRFTVPIAWQSDGRERRSVRVAYSVSGNRYGFALGAFDPTRPLTIDPSLVYSTYLGGSASDAIYGMTVDSAGNAYVTGGTFSANFPLVDAWDGTHDLQNDIFVSKLTPDGTGVVFSTLLGGSSFEDGRAVALDPSGNLWVTGITFSTDFPAVGSPSTAGGAGDAFVARFDTSGVLTFSRYLGGAAQDDGKSLAIDPTGNVVVLGGTKSTNFPTLPSALQVASGGGFDAYVVKLSAGNPNTLLYSSYLGGNGDDCAFFLGCDVALDAAGNLFLVMDTTSTNLPVPNAINSPFNGAIYHGGAATNLGGDGWIGRLQLGTNTLSYGSYIGGSGWDEPYALTLDASGVWIVGDTGSSDFPVSHALVGPGSYSGAVAHGGSDGFAMRLTWSGGANPLSVAFSTYLGGGGDDHMSGVEIMPGGDAWIGGTTFSTNMPAAAALQKINRGKRDGYVARLSWNGTTLTLPFATYHGGSNDDAINTIAIGPGGDLYFAGDTQSIDYPIARPIQATAIAGGDAIVGRMSATTPPVTLSSENGSTISPRGTIRVLLLFAEVDYSNPQCASQNVYGVSAAWPPGQVPLDADNYFDHFLAPGAQPQAYLTSYYYQGSLGQYLVLGDYYPNVVTVPCASAGTWWAHNAVISQLNSLTTPLKTKHINPMTGSPYGLDDFDFWGNESPGAPKSNYPNGVVDAILVIWRNNHNWCGACGLGLQGLGASTPLQTKAVDQVGSYNGVDSGEGSFGITISEYFHALFGGNNWHTGSGAGSHTFPFPGVGSYSTTQGQVSNTMAGYDRFHMGWKNPLKRFLLSALDPSGVELPSDISVQSHPFGATFVLRDYYTTGDAIRVKLPHFNWQTAGDVKNQYLWLENHQRNLSFDRSKWENVPGKESWSKGLYVQLQVGKNQKSGATLYGGADSTPNALASWLLQYTAEGNYDYMYRFDQAQAPSWAYCNWMNANVPTDRGQALPNPFTGFSDVYRIIDSAPAVGSLATTPTLRPLGDGILLSNDAVQTGLSEMTGSTFSTFVANCNAAGDSQDGFNSASSHNLALGIGTNPAAVPAYTLRSAYGFGGQQNAIASYENRRIRLNNLLIEIAGENVDGQGAMRVDIAWDKPRIKDDVRWAGDVDLRSDPLDPQARKMEIELAAGKQICLDRGFSPTKYLANASDGLFTDATRLTLGASSVTHLESGARLGVWNGSQLSVEPGAVLNLDAGATIAFTPQPAAKQWAPPCTQPKCTPAPMGMVAWWGLDETTGSATADSAGNNHGARVNSPAPDNGVVRGALRFTSSQSNPQTVRVPHAAALNFGSASFTFDAWIKAGGPGIVLSKHDDSINRGYEVYIDVIVGGSSQLRPVGMRINGSHHHPASCNVTLNQWSHVTLVVDRGSPAEVRCYVGGVLAGTSPLFASGSTDHGKDLLIGNSLQYAGLPAFGGVIDEVELFNKALSPAAIAAIAAAGGGGKCRDGCAQRPSGLDAWWTLDEPNGTQATDIVSGANGAISGATHSAGFNQSALTFDGVDDFVEVLNHAAVDVAQDDFTVDAWVRAAPAQDVDVLLDKRQSASSTQGWSLFLVNGRVGVQLADGIGSTFCSSTPVTSSCTNFVSNTTITDGAWHFVAVSVDRHSPTGGAIFVDGSRVMTFDPTPRSGSLSNNAPLRFGKRSFESTGHFTGELDEVEIFHRALTDAELGAIHSAGGGGKCKARIDAPSSTPVCPSNAFVDVPVTICNDSATSRQYFYTIHGLPGGDPVTGTGCNLAGPTSFTYQSAAPVTVPAMSCATVTIRVARPSGMTTHNKTSCYEAVAWDTASGTRIRDTGVLRSNFACPMQMDSNANSARAELRFDARPAPPEVAVEIVRDGALRAGERATYDIRLRNAGSRSLGTRSTLAVELPAGLDLAEATGPGFLCGAPSVVNGATTLNCTAESAALLPGASMNLRVVVLPAFRPEKVMTVCARAEVPGSVAADNRQCLSRDYDISRRSADTGDAPDSSNHRGTLEMPSAHQHETSKPPAGLIVPADTGHGVRHAHFNSMMFAYGLDVIGRFPTVFDPELGGAQGPIHWQPSSAFWLGREVSGEFDADVDPDDDGRTNIEPISSKADRDAKDDGLVASTVRLPRCATTTLDVTATMKEGSTRPLLNVWVDFNRDGDWEDTFNCQSGISVLTVREWAVQNQSVVLRPGLSTIRTTSFVSGETPTQKSPMWARVTLSDAPAPAPGDGRGPFAGYRFGETEDYLLPLVLP